MINTDNQRQQFFNARWLQVGVLVALAVAFMVGAAYFFGTGLRADTTKSVAASPIGSSLTNVRGSSSAAAAASSASLAALADPRLDYYAGLNASSAPARSASLAVLPKGSSDFSLYLRGAPAILPNSSSDFSIYLRGAPATVADSYQNEWMAFTAPESVQVKPPAAARAATLAALAKRWAPFYAGLDKALGDAGARPQGSSSGMVKPPAAKQNQWIKPEGIKPSAAASSAADQYPWIKPEGINVK